MKTQELSTRQLAVVNELKSEHLTSFQILNRINSFKLILVVYNVLDELKNKGILKSYTKQNVKYHYIESN
ncbi:hypothetical protein BW723_15250 [Polaribacter reichenbachii]|uniref:Transcriptional regulator n=1 Tax=Polaribacter reichenbachii TaxID=996801 RepID=A0A1B8U5G1_9FLAO|nr:hypothetical protein [Polaribacter reichenbachii]APZ47557.1 hypothetical protein BW723_15250 [Polaribacter reichenbachii]AUC18197.1 hypothetical protein BTO17_05695 [Polaribacter reichenbachii]OBY67090.1 hypothetical protein LPB301_04540 [Polaribacter reichenbachii]